MKKIVAVLLALSFLTACMPDDQTTYTESESSSDLTIEETSK